MQTLPDFLRFVEEKHLYEVAHENLRLSHELSLPSLEVFAHLSDEEITAKAAQLVRDFIHSVEDGSFGKAGAGLIPGMPGENIRPDEVIRILSVQKRSYYRFIPCYTTESRLALEIVSEMEEFFMKLQDAAISALSKAQQKAEEQFRQSNEKIKRLSRDLRQNVLALENVNTELESFSYSVSHDLRAPLRAIHNYTKIIFAENSGKLGTDSLHHMERIMANAKKMSQLIDDLLSFSRIGKKEMMMSDLDMNQLTELALRTVRNDFPKLTSGIVVKPLGKVPGDGILLGRVLYNLLSNAVKFSAQQSSPSIEVGAEKKDLYTQFYVKDNGVGFDMKFYDKLFGVFQRLHPPEEFEGTGVGLAIVKRIITRHGGKVWAESEPGKGATFYFTIPDSETNTQNHERNRDHSR